MIKVVIAQAQAIISQMVYTGDKRMRRGDGHLGELVAQGIALQQITIVEQETGRALFSGLLPGGADQRGNPGQPMVPHRTVAHIIMAHDLHVQISRGQYAQTCPDRGAPLGGNDTGRDICAALVHRKGNYSLKLYNLKMFLYDQISTGLARGLGIANIACAVAWLGETHKACIGPVSGEHHASRGDGNLWRLGP